MKGRCVTCYGLTLKVLEQLCRELFVIRAEVEDWGISPRGAGYLFGASVAEKVRRGTFMSYKLTFSSLIEPMVSTQSLEHTNL